MKAEEYLGHLIDPPILGETSLIPIDETIALMLAPPRLLLPGRICKE